MRHRHRVAVLAALGLLAPCAFAQTTVAGATPGNFRVTETGAASYSIPIRVPPGIAGMEPKLALTYNSQAGNGLLGVGWSLEGLSAITRCPRTVAQDGVRGGVNYDTNDRLCLDGQRLMAVSGTYGADATEYRTERESFSKVVSYGSAGNGPAWFKVWAKSGQILEYGNTADSRIEAQGKTTVRVWALYKASDTKGNDLTVAYTEDNANGDFYPARIDYTGTSGGAAGLSVRFSYQSRPDVAERNVAGSSTRMLKRLSAVTTYLGETAVLAHQLQYGTSGATARSRIESVKVCTGDGSSCLPATSVTWQTGALGVQNWSWNGGHGAAGAGWRLADLFGDGRKVYYTNDGAGNHYATRVNPDGTFQNWSWSGGHGGCSGGWDVGDLFGEGRQLYYVNCNDSASNGNHFATRLNPDGTLQNYSWYGGHGGCTGGWKLADLFGEGRQIYYVNCASHPTHNGVHHATRLNPDGTLQNYIWYNGHGGCSGGWRLGDLFGEGRQIYHVHCADGNHHATRLNADGSLQNHSWTGHGICDTGNGVLADLFGEGRQLYYGHCTHGNHYASRFNVDGSVQNYSWNGGHGICDTGPGTVADLFGEGRQLYYGHCSYGNHYATRLNPDGTLQNYSWDGGHGICNLGWDLADAFGDGRQAYYGFCTHGNHFLTRFSSQHSDVVSTITDGIGASVSISHAPLSPSVHAKDTGAAYPLVDVQFPMSVVASASRSDGVGGTQATQYVYGGLRAELGTGRGLLGFRWLEATQGATGIKARSEFRQDWPYVGLPSLARKTQSSGVTLGQVANTYSCTDPASGSACSVAPGNRYFPFVSQSVETGNDLNGAPLPTVTTNSQYDSFGNATSVVVSTGDGYSKTTTSTYSNDTTNWFLGRLTRSTVQSTTP